MKQLTIIGALPESSFIGGVSIHVRRLLQGLDAKGMSYEFADYKKMGVLKASLFILRHRGCVHLHVTNPILLLLFVVCCKLSLSRCIFTLHANYGRFAGIKNLSLLIALRLADVPVLINQQSYQLYKQINKHAHYIPAFIPPVSEPPLPEDIKQLIDECQERGVPIVSTNASKSAIDKEGNDIYGIKFLFDFFSAHNCFTLLVSDPQGAYKNKLSGGFGNVVFIDQPHSYFELLKHIDIFVRNTSTDGDALSVKEALYLNKPVLCSDVVDRPAGTILFKYSDERSFERALEEAKTFNQKGDGESEQCDVVRELIKLYLSI
jgi:glycosyltransferase involved in cell wall biosynthesis